jgi:hypothetical protein
MCARLNGGIRNKAARGEPRRGLSVGFVWGDAEGDVPIQIIYNSLMRMGAGGMLPKSGRARLEVPVIDPREKGICTQTRLVHECRRIAGYNLRHDRMH